MTKTKPPCHWFDKQKLEWYCFRPERLEQGYDWTAYPLADEEQCPVCGCEAKVVKIEPEALAWLLHWNGDGAQHFAGATKLPVETLRELVNVASVECDDCGNEDHDSGKCPTGMGNCDCPALLGEGDTIEEECYIQLCKHFGIEE